jgi:ABC-2 type transport system ATP-binding protein
MAAPLLAIEHLRVDFPGVVAVDDFSLSLEAGDLCGLIGPKGAGKTTTMRATAGLQDRTRGSVRVCGHDSAAEPEELKRRLGFMPDSSPVYEHLTTTEFLDHFARAYGVANRARRIEECLEQTWLTDRRHALCQELSRGMKQRLALARTVLPDPQVLLLDEPASGLDTLDRIDLWKLVLQLHDAGKTMLVSAPILTELSSFCNKAAILERGHLAAFGRIDQVWQRVRQRRISVKWNADAGAALRILHDAPGVRNVVATAQGATFEFEHQPEALHELLRVLILHEVHVTEWRSADEAPEPTVLRQAVTTST